MALSLDVCALPMAEELGPEAPGCPGDLHNEDILAVMEPRTVQAEKLVRVILVVLHPKTRDRCQIARGILRLLVTARCWVPVENVGSKQTLHGEIRAGRAGGTSPPLQPAKLQQAIQSQGEFVDSLSMCDAKVWEAAKGALTASQQSEIKEKRRVVAEQPTAHSARKQLEQEVAARSKRESAHQRQHKAAVNSCVLLAETGDKVKEQKTRVQLASVEAELETSREVGAHHAGCGRDVATLLSLLAAAIRKGQQQCYLPPGIRNPDLESFLTIGHMRSFFPEPQVPQRYVRKHRNLRHRITQFQLPSKLPFLVSQARQGAGWVRGHRGSLCSTDTGTNAFANAACVRPHFNNTCCFERIQAHMWPFWLKFGSIPAHPVRVILVVLLLKTRDRWQMAPCILRLLVSVRSRVLGTALPVESVGSRLILHDEIRAGLAGQKSPPLESARLQRADQSQGGRTLSGRGCLRLVGRNRRLWRQRWRRPGRPARATQVAGEEGARPRSCQSWPQRSAKGSSNAICHPASATRSWSLSWSQSANCTRISRGRRSPQRHAGKHRNLRRRRMQFQLPSQRMPGHRILVQLVLLMIQAAITSPLNQSGQLQWQKGVNKHRHDAGAYMSCLSSSHNSSFAHRASSTFQTRSPLPPSLNQCHPAPRVLSRLRSCHA